MRSIAFFTLLVALASSMVRAEEPAPQNLAEALRAGAKSWSLEQGRLSGPGGEAILEAARAAQFVLLGEGHGFADPPEFAGALQLSLGEKRFDYFVTETGFHAVRELESLLRGPRGWDAAVDLCRRHPHALAFLFFEEDLRLAESFVKLGPGARVWGIDQEMLMAPALNLELIERRAARADAAARKELSELTARLRRRTQEMIASKKYASPMAELKDADFALLRAAFPAPDEAREIVDDLALSAEIYRLQEVSGYRSNRLRSLLMKRYFMKHYRTAAAQGGTPRALFKMGAYHAGRGRSATNQFDIGNLASELAESNGFESTHILIVSPGGEQNRWFPWSADRAERRKAYPPGELDEVLGTKPFFEAAAARGGPTVFDLRPLRQRRAFRAGASPVTETLVFQYDFLVVTGPARPATIVE
ncbi:MAG: hypothetical protein JSR82_18235 [Verrucomicrobia bacterium]|nr:hypothetical protein [Verrucomicrobiota bacterium]